MNKSMHLDHGATRIKVLSDPCLFPLMSDVVLIGREFRITHTSVVTDYKPQVEFPTSAFFVHNWSLVV